MEKDSKIRVDEKIHLRTIVVEDVSENYVNWLNDYEVTKYTEQKYFKHTLESVANFVNQKYHSNNDLLFGIFLENSHIGNIKLGNINLHHMSSEISYFIGNKNFWGKGIASKCVRCVVEYAIKELDLKKINAGYYEGNEGSAKVLEKCGFVVEGIRHSNQIFNGERISAFLLGYIPN